MVVLWHFTLKLFLKYDVDAHQLLFVFTTCFKDDDDDSDLPDDVRERPVEGAKGDGPEMPDMELRHRLPNETHLID